MGSFSNQIIEQAEKRLERIVSKTKKKRKAKNEVYEKVPRIKEIDEQIKSAVLKRLKGLFWPGLKEAIASFEKN